MLITNANLITWEMPNRILENHAVLVDDGLIKAIGPSHELAAKYPEYETLDAEHQYVLPGNTCAHTHFYGAYARGMAIPGEPPFNFESILQKLWWPLDLALDEDGIRYSALVCLIEAIKHGTTTLIDHHASPNSIEGSLDIISEAVTAAGLRAVVCYEVTDRNGPTGTEAGIRENLRMLDRVRSDPALENRIGAVFGLHASLTLTDRTLDTCREAAPEGEGFHIHVAEAEADQIDSLSKHGERVVERLARFDMLGSESIFAHAVHLDDREIALLADSGTWVTHQPRSNMNNGVGIGDVEKMLSAGVQVCLGNDGFLNAMWEEWKTAYLIHKATARDPRKMPASTLVRIGVHNNAALVNQFLPGIQVGVIKEGAAADLIFVSYRPYTPLTPENIPWHLVFGFNEQMITTTIANGEVLMRDRKLMTLDEDEIYRKALAHAPKIWRNYQLNVPN